MHAFGQVLATCSIRLRTIPALTLNKSERSIPGLRATPAEISTTSAPTNAGVASTPLKPLIFTAVGIWLRSTATPGVTGAMSYKESSEPEGNCVLSRRARAWPIPPAAPRTATFILYSFFNKNLKSAVNSSSYDHNLLDDQTQSWNPDSEKLRSIKVVCRLNLRLFCLCFSGIKQSDLK